MHFRLYQPGDFTQLYLIEEECFQPPLRFPRSYMRQLVSSICTATWVAEEEGVLAGFAIVEWLLEATETTSYIETVEVGAAWRKRGIGAELLLRLERSARKAGTHSIWLHVDAENAPAIHLYEGRGYTQRGREENYYARQRPALIYVKLLSELNADR